MMVNARYRAYIYVDYQWNKPIQAWLPKQPLLETLFSPTLAMDVGRGHFLLRNHLFALGNTMNFDLSLITLQYPSNWT